jgi:hypothetical protein
VFSRSAGPPAITLRNGRFTVAANLAAPFARFSAPSVANGSENRSARIAGFVRSDAALASKSRLFFDPNSHGAASIV